MMSVKKMIVFGATAIVTVSLIGCKDDDDDACDYGSSPSFDDMAACTKCLGEKTDLQQAWKDCGGSGTYPSVDDIDETLKTGCEDVEISSQTDLDTAVACKVCVIAEAPALGAVADVANALAKPAFESCGGAADKWTV